MIAATLLAMAITVTAVVEASTPAPAERGWHQGVWYEIFVRSFQDSDGDGVGDLQGVISRLSYLADLGISGIWLMPIHPSPSYHGYDVTDYMAVNPEYGTLDDMRQLIDAAHALSIRVILDFVPNHSSDRHPWFLAASANDRQYRDYYTWEESPAPLRGTLGSNAWHAHPGDAGPHYLGLFSHLMPDLNHRNPAVMQEMKDAARFWLDLGVDGFRVDAVQHMIEGEGGQIANTSETYEWVREFSAFMREEAPHAFLVGETWTEMPAIVRYHTDANLHMSFDYPLWRVLHAAVQARSAADLGAVVQQAEQLYPEGAVRGTFISNHDQTRPGTLLSFPRRDEQRLKLAAGLLFTLPGTPFMYYGDEIGMPDGPGSHDVEKRTPMRWTEPDDSGYFGFSTTVPWTDSGELPEGVSVEAQRADDDSVWHAYRRLINLRNTLPAIDVGSFELLDAGSRAVLAARRSADGQQVLVLANLGARAVSVDLVALGVAPEDVRAWHRPLSSPETEAELVAAQDGRNALELAGLELLILELR